MALTRFLLSSPKILAAKTAISMIWRSPIMTVGVACEIFALIGAAWNWIDSYQWLPNAALTLATVGAVIVAIRVAWDYHGRGLNAKQKEESKGILTNVGLNEAQSEEMAEAIKSSGLTSRQESDMVTALQEMNIASIVLAQKAVIDAMNQLRNSDHGHVAIINVTGFCQMDVQCVAPPATRGECQRQHPLEPEADFDLLEIAKSLHQPFHNPAFLWKHPSTGSLCHTNHRDPSASLTGLVFSLEDCVPKWRVPIVGDYWLTRDDNRRYTWEQRL